MKHYLAGGFACGIAAALLVSAITACSPRAPLPEVDSVSVTAVIQSLQGRSILFAHQSVGSNILDGVRDLAGGRLAIVPARDAAAGAPGLRQFYVGENGDPLGKIADFRKAFDTAGERAVDVALLKFCYLDFAAHTDVAVVAQAYLDTYAQLHARFPGTRFIAVTAPLTVVHPWSLRSIVRRVLGSAPSGFDANLKRAQFNQLLRTKVAAMDLFDLAALESASADGPRRVSFGDITVDVMDARWTDDGGHLNAAGARVAAEHFLARLAGSADP